MKLLFRGVKFLIPNYIQLQSFLTLSLGVLIKTTQHMKFAQQGWVEKSTTQVGGPADEII
jgi:hypothetical protein